MRDKEEIKEVYEILKEASKNEVDKSSTERANALINQAKALEWVLNRQSTTLNSITTPKTMSELFSHNHE